MPGTKGCPLVRIILPVARWDGSFHMSTFVFAGTQIFGQTLSWCVYEGWFWVRLVFVSIDLVKQMPPSVGGPCSISWKPEQNKKADHPGFLLNCLTSSDLFFFLPSNWKWNIGPPGSTNLQTSFSLWGVVLTTCSFLLIVHFSDDPNFSSEGVEPCAGPENPSTVAGAATYSLCSVNLLLLSGLFTLCHFLTDWKPFRGS